MTDHLKPDPRSLQWAESYARLLDSKFQIPGTKFRFGLDPILGLIPGFGDGASLIMQLMLAFTLIRWGVSGELSARILINVLLDTLIGSIPLIGWVFDFYFKANQRNLELTKAYIREGKYSGKGTALWVALALIIVLTFSLLVYLIYLLVSWLIGLF